MNLSFYSTQENETPTNPNQEKLNDSELKPIEGINKMIIPVNLGREWAQKSQIQSSNPNRANQISHRRWNWKKERPTKRLINRLVGSDRRVEAIPKLVCFDWFRVASRWLLEFGAILPLGVSANASCVTFTDFYYFNKKEEDTQSHYSLAFRNNFSLVSFRLFDLEFSYINDNRIFLV